MKKIFSVVLCAIMAFSICALTGCDKHPAGEYWKVVNYAEDGLGDALSQKVGFTLSRNSQKIKDVWLNVKEIEGETVKITLQKYTSKTTDGGTSDFNLSTGSDYILNKGAITITKKQVKDANKNEKGWIKLNTSDWDKDFNNVALILTGDITIREIVFIGADDKKISVSLDKAFIFVETDAGVISKVFSASELAEDYADQKGGIPNFLIDSQSSFDEKDGK